MPGGPYGRYRGAATARLIWAEPDAAVGRAFNQRWYEAVLWTGPAKAGLEAPRGPEVRPTTEGQGTSS